MSFPRFALLPLVLATIVLAAADGPQGTTVTSDRLIAHSTGTETFSSFIGHVLVVSGQLHIVCDRLDTISSRVGDKSAIVGTQAQFEHLQADGHVHITEGDREAVCGHAEVKELQNRIVLTKDPVVIDHSNGTKWAGQTNTRINASGAAVPAIIHP